MLTKIGLTLFSLWLIFVGWFVGTCLLVVSQAPHYVIYLYYALLFGGVLYKIYRTWKPKKALPLF